ncbi:IS3 family transposase [Novosphingobium resinovorum]|uniref:IS3 family transposase n=1 Tax=Novosphingobium resinovorum TaxID=158500 RepID=UPI003AF37692
MSGRRTPEPASPGRCWKTKLIRQAWNDSGKVYGCHNLHGDLLDQGETCCPRRVARLPRLAGIKG